MSGAEKGLGEALTDALRATGASIQSWEHMTTSCQEQFMNAAHAFANGPALVYMASAEAASVVPGLRGELDHARAQLAATQKALAEERADFVALESKHEELTAELARLGAQLEYASEQIQAAMTRPVPGGQ